MSHGSLLLTLAVLLFASAYAQRITTIQLDGVQYFVSRMNPYSPALNYFLAYQYCRSLGLQLASFESREKSDSLMQYLRNAGYNKYDYWTSGNRLGTDMLLWMSSGTPFNTTFDYMRKVPTNDLENNPTKAEDGTAASSSADATVPKPVVKEARNRRPGRQSVDEIISGCVTLKAPTLEWDTDDCLEVKDFICEQTRCYYYNYGSIPVSPAQGKQKVRPTLPPLTSTSSSSSQTETSTSEIPTTTTTVTSDKTADSSPAEDTTVNRRITLRPVAAEDSSSSTTINPLGSTAERAHHFASRKFPEKESDANVVYVTAVGAESIKDQTLAYFENSSTIPPNTTRPFRVDKPVQTSIISRARIARRRHIIDPVSTGTSNKKATTIA